MVRLAHSTNSSIPTWSLLLTWQKFLPSQDFQLTCPQGQKVCISSPRPLYLAFGKCLKHHSAGDRQESLRTQVRNCSTIF